MKEFLLVFRRDHNTKEIQPSPEQMQEAMKTWQNWMGNIAAQNKLVSKPQRWSADGRVVKSNNIVTNGPYVEIKEAIGGLIIIRANDFDEAVEIAKGCPVLEWQGNVEVRMAIEMDEQ